MPTPVYIQMKKGNKVPTFVTTTVSGESIKG